MSWNWSKWKLFGIIHLKDREIYFGRILIGEGAESTELFKI